MTTPKLTVARALIPSLSRVDTRHETDHYWEVLHSFWGGRGHAHGFPGCNPKSLSRAALPALGARDYRIALKSDGVRYALLLTMRPEGGAVALMIDRSRNMFEVEVIAPDRFFVNGTLLEGELVWRQPDERAMVFHVFDALRVAGDDVSAAGFAERLRRAEACTRLSEEIARSDDAEAQASACSVRSGS